MKKLIYGGLFLALFGITIVSCKKTDSKQIASESSKTENADVFDTPKSGFDSEFQVGNEGRFLVFNNEIGYSHAVDNPSEVVRQNLYGRINSLNHYSWKDYVEGNSNQGLDTLIDDDYISSILSDDKTVQIGQHIYKINPETQQVFALHIKDKKDYNDLKNNNINNPHIRVFSFNENVLDAIKIIGGDPTPPGIFCSDSYANARSETRTLTYNVSTSLYHKFICKVKYVAVGIYFHLKSEIDARTTYYLTSWQTKNFEGQLRIDNYRIYKIRCQSESPWYYYSIQGFTNSSNEYVSGSYQGSKGLNRYKMLTNFWFKNGTNWVKAWNGSDMYSGYHGGVNFGY